LRRVSVGVGSGKSRFSGSGDTVSFVERFAGAERLGEILHRGRRLVEATASYLEGAGRRDARKLEPPLSLTYTTESMRLTTRLMQLSSWLMVARAERNGEITSREALARYARINLELISRPAHTPHFGALPRRLQDLVRDSIALHDAIRAIDRVRRSDLPVTPCRTTPNGVAAQFAKLELAFSQ